MTTILIIDTNQSRIATLTQYCTTRQYTAPVVSTSDQALAYLKTQPVDLILLASDLPDNHSETLLEQLATNDMTPRPSVILLTNTQLHQEVYRYLERGVSDYLDMPLHPSLLASRMQAVLVHGQLDVKTQEQAVQQEEHQALERDVLIARRIQISLLPKELPQPTGWEIAAEFHPAREVAGDFYDAFMLTQNRRVGVVIADVCDKGVGSALFMALSRSLLRAFAQQHYSISSWTDVLAGDAPFSPRGSGGRQSLPSIGAASLKNAMVMTNDYIINTHTDMNMFVTLFFGVLDPTTGTLLYINGGHESPMIIGDGTIKAELEPTGPAVGIFPDADFTIGQAQLDPNDVLFCYTDGVTDARSPSRAFFGRAGMEHILLKQPIASARGLLEQMEADLHAHINTADQFDDITMLAVRRVPV